MEDAKKERILVIEDEDHIAQGLELNLSKQGYEVRTAKDGLQGLDKWRTWKPDIIVLDIMLPMIDGFSVLRTIRKEDERVPILILSAKGNTASKIKGLKYGVDDYLAKPFDLEEFILRIERLLKKKEWYRQTGSAEQPEKEYAFFAGKEYVFGPNRIDFVTCKADCIIGKTTLTEQEITLLKIFITNRGRALSRGKLLKAGWGYTSDTTTRTVDNFIVRFRKYFEPNPKKPKFFKSRRSVGYIFDHND